jgi:segregation and condensation protein B
MSKQDEIEAVVEAILFASPDPVAPDKLIELFGDKEAATVEDALAAVAERYREGPHRGVVFERVAGGVRLITRPALHGELRKFFEITGRSRLSMAALETLAIVAYRQPVTAPEIQEVRGVNASGVLRTLLERRLVRIAGRKPVVGKPFLYRTTREFLMHFGLQSLDDLPPLEEFEELMSEPEAETGDDA